MERVLAAVDDSPAGLAAARQAVELAATYGASLRLVHVLANSDVASALAASGGIRLSERQAASSQALFRHLKALAREAGVEVETVELHGEPAQLILHQARTWPADLVVIGRGEHPGVGGPYVGRQTRMVLEFADQPVLVVPRGGTVRD